jgi:hypothetical protein
VYGDTGTPYGLNYSAQERVRRGMTASATPRGYGARDLSQLEKGNLKKGHQGKRLFTLEIAPC